MQSCCPRCLGPGPVPPDSGALSRADNETTVCGSCGMDEAIRENAGLAHPPTWRRPVASRSGLVARVGEFVVLNQHEMEMEVQA